MDFLILYNGHKDSESLRWALRTLDKNGQNVGRVFLVSDTKPAWCSDKVLHIHYKSDPKLYKEFDITAAIFHAVNNCDIADRFLIGADDYFYIEPTDFNEYPVYLKGILPETPDGHPEMGGWKYVESLANTRALLQAAGLPFNNYSGHHCFYGDRRLMAEFAGLFRASRSLRCAAVFDSLMANIIVDKKNVLPVRRKDNKVNRATSLADLRQQIGETEHCFSTTEAALANGVRSILQELFPEPSIYEK